MKVASLVEELLSLCGRRATLYNLYDAAIDRLKQSKDQSAFAATNKKLNQDYNNVTQSVNDVCAHLIKEDPDTADKVKYHMVITPRSREVFLKLITSYVTFRGKHLLQFLCEKYF